jgi:hypothetical protein
MKRPIALWAVLVLAVGVPVAAGSAPYEDQKIQIQRLQQEKLRGAGTAPTPCPAMHPMPSMQEMRQHMTLAEEVDRMSAEQMRHWIKEHAAMMDRMDRQMRKE